MDQTAGNVLAAIKREVTPGTAAASGAGATQVRVIDSPGMTLGRGTIDSAERRRDRVKAMGRLGAKSPSGSYNTELTVGGAIDLLLESIARGTWSAALTPGAVANATTTANTIVRPADSWLTEGYRVGDIIRITVDAGKPHVNLNLRVTSVTATVLTVAGTPLTLDAVGRAITVTRLKKVMTPTTPVYHAYSIEQYDADIDLSELFVGCRLTGLSLSLRPNAMVTCAWTFMGMDRQIIQTAAAPYFTSPDLTTGVPLVADDGWIRYNGVDVAAFTGLDLNFQIAAAGQPVIGSVVTPDIFMNDLTISGSVTAIRQDLQALMDFDAETEFELGVLLQEPEADPKDAIGIFLPRVKIGGIDAPFQGGDGAKIETRTLMVAPSAGDADNDATAAVFYSTGA